MTKAYAAYTKDNELLAGSSSGGMFVTLAEKIIALGGAVACTVYDYEEGRACFTLIKSAEKLREASGSKYIQSDMSGIFGKAEEFMAESEDKPLMFIGTGCQADSFMRYAEHKGFRERVYAVDLICFGVTSPGFWQDYTKSLERKYGGRIEKVSFRDKRKGWEHSSACAYIKGREISLRRFMRLYYMRCNLRPSCYRCRFTATERSSDITIGDYWGIRKVMPDFVNPMGTSLVLTHSEKGEELFGWVKDDICFRESRVEDCVQPMLEHPNPVSSRRSEFWLDYLVKGAGYTVKNHGKYYIDMYKKANEFGEISRNNEPYAAAGLIVKKMSLKEKICQMLIAAPESFAARTGRTRASEMLQKRYPMSGVCFYANNLKSVRQTHTIIDGFQSASVRYSGIGMFISIDEEGGNVARAAKKLGTTAFGDMCGYSDEKEVYEIGRTLAHDLTGLGFNLNFAPVADVYAQGRAEFLKKRCFSDDPETVSRMITAEIKGLNDGGIMCAPKHFPGHGSASGDSHEGLVQNERSRSELESIDMKPFRAAIAAGAPVIMTGHIVTPCIDPELPASLSKEANRILREELGHKGLIICDAIRMKAIRNRYGFGKSVAMAVEAGCDLVLGVLSIPHAVKAVRKSLKEGRISIEQIDESVRRIISAKIKYGIMDAGLTVKGSCCGCTACEAVCPVGAVVMKPDREGFYYPDVDRSKCVGCGKCGEICGMRDSLIFRLRGECSGETSDLEE